MDFSQILQSQLNEQLSGGLMDALTQQTGADQRTTTAATSAAISTLLGSLARNASTPEGANALGSALERDHDGSILDIIGGLMNASGGGQQRGGGGLGGLIGGMLSGAGGRQKGGGALGDLIGGMLQSGNGSSNGGGALGGLLGSVLSGAMQGGSAQPSGGGGLGDLLGGMLGGKAAGNQEDIPPQFRRTMNGGGILKHVLGDRQEEAMREVSQSSGLSLDKVGPLMATLAPILMGMLGKTKRENGLDSGGLAGSLIDMVTRSQQNPRQNAPDLGLAGALLDRDGDGSMMDDIAGIGVKMLGNYFRR
ncbi:MAG: DUF937 domain-containing protein [Bacteroidota bacterium]